MNDKTNEQPDLTEAVAKDYYALIQRDLSIMSPGQLEITKKALADFQERNRDTTQEDIDRQIARLNQSDFEKLKNELL